jgi:hypothetical protein
MLICSFTFRGPNQQDFLAEVDADERDFKTAVVAYSIKGTIDSFKAEMSFDLTVGSLTVVGLTTPTLAYLACVAACGVGNLTQEILDCWKAGHKTAGALVTCLKGKGHSIAGSLANCVISCTPSLAAGGL